MGRLCKFGRMAGLEVGNEVRGTSPLVEFRSISEHVGAMVPGFKGTRRRRTISNRCVEPIAGTSSDDGWGPVVMGGWGCLRWGSPGWSKPTFSACPKHSDSS